MKILKKVIAGILASATLFSFVACSNKGEVTNITEDEFVSFLSDDMKWTKGDKFDYVDSYTLLGSTVTDDGDGSQTLTTVDVNVPAIVVYHTNQFDDAMISYCIFDTNEEAEDFYKGHISRNDFFNIAPDASSYNEGSNGYMVFKIGKNTWDAYYYFDNVIIEIVCVGDKERCQVNKFLKEFGFPQLPR